MNSPTKHTHGGRRPGAGRPKGSGKRIKENRKVTWGGRFAPNVAQFLKEKMAGSASPWVEGLIRGTDEFKTWEGKNAKGTGRKTG